MPTENNDSNSSPLDCGVSLRFSKEDILLEMDTVNELICSASINCPDAELYRKGNRAFWRACHMIANDEMPEHLKAN